MTLGRDFLFLSALLRFFATFETFFATFFRPERSEGKKNVEKFETKHEKIINPDPKSMLPNLTNLKVHR